MIMWISQNISTIIICIVLAGAVAGIIIKMIKNKKMVNLHVDVDAVIVQCRKYVIT